MSSKQKTKVTFASDYTTADGKDFFKGGDSYSVPASDARIYINIGKARLADEGQRAHRQPEAGPGPGTEVTTTSKAGN